MENDLERMQIYIRCVQVLSNLFM